MMMIRRKLIYLASYNHQYAIFIVHLEAMTFRLSVEVPGGLVESKAWGVLSSPLMVSKPYNNVSALRCCPHGFAGMLDVVHLSRGCRLSVWHPGRV